jgi:phospholipid-binding lipoprotein MlaA
MKKIFVRIPFSLAGGQAVLAGILLVASGCAALSDGLSPSTDGALTGLPSSPAESIKADFDRTDAGSADSIATPPEFIIQALESRPAESASETGKDAPAKDVPDEFYDPFAKKEDALDAGEDYDPWEGFNSVMFEFNRKFDKYLLKPVAKIYDKILPDKVEVAIGNFMHNARFGPRLINNVLQVKIKTAGIELSRFLINSTLGIGGLFDPANDWFGLDTEDEDMGQTLGTYGVPPGPYLVLPLLPPLTLRDLFGLVLDFGADPINYFVFPTFEIDDLPSLIAHKNRDTTTIAQFSTRVEEVVNYRALNLETFEGVEEATVDLYSAVRNAYLQKRAKAIRE